MDQKLLQKVAKHLGKTPQQVRVQASKRAGREGVVSDVALINMARDLGVGVATAVKRLQPQHQQQLSAARVVTTRRPAQPRVAGQRSVRPRTRRESAQVLVFISHSSEDKKVADRLVELLNAAFRLPADRIRQTSMAGHKLALGTDTDEALRREVLACEILIGLITPNSQRSTYVLLELGARWGAKRNLIPLAACGVTPGALRGPLGRMNAGNCSVRTDVFQLISDVGSILGREPEKPQVFDKHVMALVRASKNRPARRRRKRT